MDFEDAGDDLAMMVNAITVNEHIQRAAGILEYPLPKFLGRKKEVIRLRSEFVCVYAVLVIHEVNKRSDYDASKKIIDSFLAKSRQYYFNDIEESISDFSGLYSENVSSYFGIMEQDNSMLGLSFHLYKAIGFKDFGDVNKQLFLSELMSYCIKRTNEILDELFGSDVGAITSVFDAFEDEISSWKVDAATAALEMVVAYSEADHSKIDELKSKLTFSQFQTVIRYLDRVAVEEEADIDVSPGCYHYSFHEVLDCIVECLEKPIKSALKEGRNNDGNILLTCEMISYALAFFTIKDIKVEEIVWNTFRAGVENRMMLYVSEDVIHQAQASKPPARKNVFISYAPPSVRYLDEMERLIGPVKQSEELSAKFFLDHFGVNENDLNCDVLKDLDEVIFDALAVCRKHVVADVQGMV